MQTVIELLGENTTLGIVQIVYDSIIEDLRQTAPKGLTQYYAYTIEDMEWLYESDYEDELEKQKGRGYGIIKLIDRNIIRVDRPLRADSDEIKLNIKHVKRGENDYHILNINIELIGRHIEEEGDDAIGLARILNYEPEKLKKLIKNHLDIIFDGIIENRWLLLIETVDMHIGFIRKQKFIAVIFDLQFKLIDEEPFRPQGRMYKHIEDITRVGRKQHH